jgi:hypothetical protein
LYILIYLSLFFFFFLREPTNAHLIASQPHPQTVSLYFNNTQAFMLFVQLKPQILDFCSSWDGNGGRQGEREKDTASFSSPLDLSGLFE